MHPLAKGALAAAIAVLLLACSAEPQPGKKAVPTPPTVNSVVCKEYTSHITGGACSWYCNPGLITIAFTDSTHIPYRASGETPNARRLLNWETDTAALFAQPLATTLQWKVGLGPFAAGGPFSRLSADDLENRQFGGFVLINGDVSSQAAYHKYARLKAGRLTVNGNCVALLRFADSPDAQIIRLPETYPLDTLYLSHIKLKVTEVYPGQQDSRLAIAEMQLDGTGSHSATAEVCWKENEGR